MDPITAAVIAAVAAGAAAAVPEVSKQAISDAYAALKSLIKSKFGEQSEVAQAVEKVEAQPDKAGPKGVLQDAITDAHADQDPALQNAAQKLVEQINASKAGRAIVAKIEGDYNIQLIGSGNVINVNQPNADEKKT